MKKSTRNILIGSGVVAATVGAVTAISYTLTRKLLTAAMDREEPPILVKGRDRLSGNTEEYNEILQSLAQASERLENSGCERVEITSRDGLRLVGHWRPCENAKRVIVAMHGWRSSWSRDFGAVSDFWHDSGCSVLFAEQRAQGGSDGDYMGFGLLERYDCADWAKWADKHTSGSLPIYIGGVSMGATTVLMAAGLDLPQSVKGIVADCGFTSPHAIWKHVAENNLRLSYDALRGAVASDLCKKKINIGAKDYSTLDAMSECKIPVLFIHGTDDRFVPVEMTYENYKACAAPKKLLIVPGAEHAMSYIVDKTAYENAVSEFFASFDRT